MKKCPHCAEEILDDAKKCKHCQSELGETHVVTELTSKQIKGQMLICLGVFIGGVVLAVIGKDSEVFPAIAGLMMLGSFFYFIYLKIKRWWHHG